VFIANGDSMDLRASMIRWTGQEIMKGKKATDCERRNNSTAVL
jgi:hypothetical protein